MAKVKVTRPCRDRKLAISSEPEGLLTSNLVYGWSTMTHITDMRGDLQAGRSEWLFKSPLARGRGHIVAASLQAAQLGLSENV